MTTADEVWRSFAHDPRDPSIAPLRASDTDRDIVHGVLVDAFADGRLTREEYDERTTSVTEARTLGQLPPLMADLIPERPLAVSGSFPARGSLAGASPADIERRALEEWDQHRRRAVLGFLGPSIICWAIWLATDWGTWGFPWPLIVSAVTLMNLVGTLVKKQEHIAEEVRRLEKKQAKEIGKQSP